MINIITTDAERSFLAFKCDLVSMTHLAYPVLHAPTVLSTIASAKTVGLVLQQDVAGELRPVAFFSKRLKRAQRSYSALSSPHGSCPVPPPSTKLYSCNYRRYMTGLGHFS